MVDSAGTLKLPRGMGGLHGTGYKPHSDGCGIRARLMMGWFGLRIMAERIKAKGLDPYNLQGLGLVLLLPTILMLLVVSDEMPTEVIATLLGGVAGYIFGRGGR